ncbi:hypothetical protein [Actinacidiphila oryziradicis]|nr:hypothetical protein [Actinacidiphila oryziradicis]
MMPEARTTKAVLGHSHLLAAPALTRDYNLSTRPHVLLRADQRRR